MLSVIQRFVGRGENPDDLFQVGCVGLLKAIDNFDVSQNVRFSTYGVPMIVGEIRRYLRDNSAIRVSRSMRDTAYRVLQAREKLQRENQREPTVEQIARGAGPSLARGGRVRHGRGGRSRLPSSTPSTPTAATPAALWIRCATRATPMKAGSTGSLCAKRWTSSRRASSVFSHALYDGKTQMEVSGEVGISQAQVSRLEKNAISTIRRNL